MDHDECLALAVHMAAPHATLSSRSGADRIETNAHLIANCYKAIQRANELAREQRPAGNITVL